MKNQTKIPENSLIILEVNNIKYLTLHKNSKYYSSPTIELINEFKWENVGTKHFDDNRIFIGFANEEQTQLFESQYKSFLKENKIKLEHYKPLK